MAKVFRDTNIRDEEASFAIGDMELLPDLSCCSS
jgi:hypothetical protein